MNAFRLFSAVLCLAILSLFCPSWICDTNGQDAPPAPGSWGDQVNALLTPYTDELRLIGEQERRGEISSAEAESRSARVHERAREEYAAAREQAVADGRVPAPPPQPGDAERLRIVRQHVSELNQISQQEMRGEISSAEAASRSERVHAKCHEEYAAVRDGESAPRQPSAVNQQILDILRRYGDQLDRIRQEAARGNISKDEAMFRSDLLHALAQWEHAAVAAKAGLSAGPEPRAIEDIDCDYWRSFVIPRSKPPIAKLRSDPQRKAVADEIFAFAGGLDAYEKWLDHVCDDDVIDAAERKQLRIMSEIMGLGSAEKP